jgi:hypothetical protein
MLKEVHIQTFAELPGSNGLKTLWHSPKESEVFFRSGGTLLKGIGNKLYERE